MQTFWSETQLSHSGARFFQRGRLVASPEKPERGEAIRSELLTRGHDIAAPDDLGSDPILAIHDAGYIDFLKSIYRNWTDAFGDAGAVMPNVFGEPPAHSSVTNLVGLLGTHTGDLACEIRGGTWSACYASAQCAANAAAHTLRSGKPSYGLCRPPGHHASASRAMGFCYLNNSAIAAQMLRSKYQRVAIFDMDVHHGNGTQSIFYERSDVFTGSMHSDPAGFYPFFHGYETETGKGDGCGFNTNVCYARGAGDEAFLDVFSRLSKTMIRYQPQALVIAFGVDALRSDPHGEHDVSPEAIAEAARRFKQFDIPTTIIQEGGYPSPELAPTVARFLESFEHG